MTTTEPAGGLLTIGDLANLFGISVHRLKYAIEQNKIEPTRRVGIIRVWSEDKVPVIESALARIAAKRPAGARKLRGAVLDDDAGPEADNQPNIES